ncbi:hypothetical protein [Streptomyces sp. NPDC001165]|uniref:hypothetical protein n=1 Tax=Streptomyces sp. NPDC001165 TaxID=3364546 RepID=UPI0036CB1BB3
MSTTVKFLLAIRCVRRSLGSQIEGPRRLREARALNPGTGIPMGNPTDSQGSSTTTRFPPRTPPDAAQHAGFTVPGSREDQATFICKNPDSDFQCNADRNAARDILHLYRIGHVIVEVPAAGRCGRKAARTVKPVAVRQTGIPFPEFAKGGENFKPPDSCSRVPGGVLHTGGDRSHRDRHPCDAGIVEEAVLRFLAERPTSGRCLRDEERGNSVNEPYAERS